MDLHKRRSAEGDRAAIRRRHAAVKLCWVQGHGENTRNAAADSLAKEGANLPERTSTHETQYPAQCVGVEGDPLLAPKVTISIPQRAKTLPSEDTMFTREPDLHNEPWFKRKDGTWTQAPREWFNRKRDSHRRRAHRARIQEENLQRLYSAEGPKAFWSLIREWCTGKTCAE